MRDTSSRAMPVTPSAASATPAITAEPGYDYQACQELMRGGSKTFFAASRLLPSRVRGPAIALYAFCRVADDAIDATGTTSAMR